MNSRISRSKQVYNREKLESLHTKQLLNRQRYFYRFWDSNNKFNVKRTDDEYNDFFLYEGSESDAKHERTWMKEILSTREHVPNKQESRELRILRAKQGRK